MENKETALRSVIREQAHESEFQRMKQYMTQQQLRTYLTSQDLSKGNVSLKFSG